MADMAERRALFARLIDEHGASLRRLAAAYLSDPTAREDLFQEIALAIWTGIPSFRGEASERTWVYRIAHNTAATHWQKLRRRSERERQPKDADPEPAARSTPESELSDSDERARFFAALRELPTMDFQIVTMHLSGLSYAEIGDVVGLTQTNVGARLTRARQSLAARMTVLEAQR